MTSAEPTLFLVDDDPTLCESIRYLGASIGLPVETYSDPRVFLDVFDPERPGCLLLDLLLPGMSGLDLQQALARRGALLPIIFLSAHGDIPAAVRAVQNGALEFFEKAADPTLLLNRVHEAFEIDRQRRRRLARRSQIEEMLNRLTRREREVMELVAVGKANKVIAEDLVLSAKTIEHHRAHMTSKLRVASVAALVKLLIEYRDLCDLGPAGPSGKRH